MSYGEWCPTCGAEIVSVTRGIPSMGTCANGHRIDRRDALRRAPSKPEMVSLSEAEAMVAAALLEVAGVFFSCADTMSGQEVGDAILALIPQPASAALDKLIAEAVAAATPTMQRAARVLHDEAMAAAYLGENVTEDEAAMLQFIDALGGKTKVINALHALATATKGDQT